MLEDVRVKDGLWSGRAWLSGRQREWQQLQWAEGIPAPSYSCCPRCDEDVGTACIITINRLTAGTECVWWSQWAQKCVRCTFLQTFVISSVSERVCVCLCLMMPFCQLVWSVYAAVKGWKRCKCGCQSVSMYLCVCVWIENPECACVWVSGKLGIRTASYECSEASLGATGGSVREKHNLLLCFVIFTLILSQVIALATQIHLSWLQSLSIFIFGEYDREKWKAEANANVGE